MSTTKANSKQQRAAHLRWVPIRQMAVSPLAQRAVNPARVDQIAAHFDPEDVGTPTVSYRDETYYIIDGQHRVEAMRLIGWDDQQIQCWTYEGMTEDEEAERFLKLNDTLSVNAMSKFRVSVAAGRERESDIDRVVRAANCVVTNDKIPGAIGAVGTLGKIYDRSGPGTLSRTIRIIRDAYGDAGLEAPILDGIGLLCQRYNGAVDDAELVRRLAAAAGGAGGLLNLADKMRAATGNAKAHCVAAAAVEIYNRGRAPRANARLADWFRSAA